MKLLFVTGNSRKFEEASSVLRQYGVTVEQLQLDIDEIQHRRHIEEMVNMLSNLTEGNEHA